jgi:hypothetical protein
MDTSHRLAGVGENRIQGARETQLGAGIRTTTGFKKHGGLVLISPIRASTQATGHTKAFRLSAFGKISALLL